MRSPSLLTIILPTTLPMTSTATTPARTSVPTAIGSRWSAWQAHPSFRGDRLHVGQKRDERTDLDKAQPGFGFRGRPDALDDSLRGGSASALANAQGLVSNVGHSAKRDSGAGR